MSLKRKTESGFTDVSGVKRYDGSAWQNCSFVKRWDGEQWVKVWPNVLDLAVVTLQPPGYPYDGSITLSDDRTQCTLKVGYYEDEEHYYQEGYITISGLTAGQRLEITFAQNQISANRYITPRGLNEYTSGVSKWKGSKANAAVTYSGTVSGTKVKLNARTDYNATTYTISSLTLDGVPVLFKV